MLHILKAKLFTSAIILVTLIIYPDFVHGFTSEQNLIDSVLLTEKIGANRTVVIVDANGQGDFKSVQAAVDHVPNGNSQWIIIHITKGIYREKVTIPRSKPYIFMRGDGRGKTSIVWSQSSAHNYESATFKVEAPNFVAFGISFKNTASASLNRNMENNKSVAAFVGADQAAFYQCAFFSNQNTLFDYKGRHYYDNCYIQGSVDFIFGRGQALFHDCELFVIGNSREEVRGSITANYRHRHSEDSGFVFLKGKVYGAGSDVYLGRAKGAHSRVVFANTYLSRTVIPHGWANSSYPGTTHNLYHAEYRCHGPGSGLGNRAHWSKQLTDEDAAPFLSVDFIKGQDWLPAWL